MNKKYRFIIIEDKEESTVRLTEELKSRGHDVLYDVALNGTDGDMTLKGGQLALEIGKELVKNSEDALSYVIDDILDLSKMEAGTIVIEKVTFDIRNILEKVVKAHSVKANEKGLDFRYLVDKRIPKLLKGDPYRLQKLLNNLLCNAIKFTEAGCIKMVVEHMGQNENTHYIKYSVTDTGIGIIEHDLKMLFKNFSQIDSSYTRRFIGIGLRMAITKQLAEMLGGSIDVKSEKGKDIFECILQFEAGEEDNQSEDEEFQMKKSLSSLSILIVEDDSINQTITEIMLKRMGHKTQIAENGKKALELYETGSFDIILMDIQLPEMDGIQATKLIRQKESLSGGHIPIIAFTAYALNGDKERFLEAGMDEYIIKPFKINELYSIIESVSKKFNKNNKYGEMQYKPVNDTRAVKGDSTITDIGSIIERLTSCTSLENVNQVEKDAHQLKMAASASGMDKIRIIAFRIELASRRGDTSEIESLIKELANADLIIDECIY